MLQQKTNIIFYVSLEMIHAYQEIYLSKAQSVLGDAFDYAVNTYKITGNDFVKLFIASCRSNMRLSKMKMTGWRQQAGVSRWKCRFNSPFVRTTPKIG